MVTEGDGMCQDCCQMMSKVGLVGLNKNVGAALLVTHFFLDYIVNSAEC